MTWGEPDNAITHDRGGREPRAPAEKVSNTASASPRGGDGLRACSSLTGEDAPCEKNSFRTCPVCGRKFTPGSPNAVYCPPTAEQRARVGPNTQARSRCAKRADNARRYGWEPSSRPLPAPFDCAQCGEHCIPGENVAPHARKFCKPRCKRRWHYLAEKAAA